MSLFDKAREAREIADRSTDPADHAYAAAMEAAVGAEFAAMRRAEEPPADTTGIPDPPVSHILIPRPERQFPPARWRNFLGASNFRSRTGC
jgi:hypothetical protein